MAGIKFTNFARSALAVGIGSGDTSLSVTGTQGSRFPTLSAGDYFYVVLENAVLQREIVKVTARVNDTFTVVRGQDGTTAQAWVAGDIVELRFNAAGISDSLGNAVQRTSATGSALLPSGTTAQQDAVPTIGAIRHNSTLSRIEAYLAAAWRAFAFTDTVQTWTNPQRSSELTDNDGSFDLNAAFDFICTPTAGFSLTFTNIPASPTVQKGTIVLANPSGYAVTAAAGTKVNNTLLTTISAAGTHLLAYRTSNGVVYVTTSGAMA